MLATAEITEILKHAEETTGYSRVASSAFKAIYFSSTEQTLIQVWNEKAYQFSNYEFEQEANLLLDQVSKYKPTYIITDQRLYRHILSDDQHRWYIINFISRLVKNDVEKFAIVINEDLRQQAKLEEIIDDIDKYRNEFLIPTRFFNSITNAIEWK